MKKIKKLLCKCFGHKWVSRFRYNNVKHTSYAVLECERCGKECKPYGR